MIHLSVTPQYKHQLYIKWIQREAKMAQQQQGEVDVRPDNTTWSIIHVPEYI